MGMSASLVRLTTRDGSPLRSKNGREYFKMTVPSVGNTIKYYNFNEGIPFEGDTFVYFKVVSVIQELQESCNGLFEERFDVMVERQ